MKLVLLTALGVGGATVIGALIGFGFKKISLEVVFSELLISSLENPVVAITTGILF